MKLKNKLLIMFFITAFVMINSCKEEAFTSNTEAPNVEGVTSLKYADIVNAREGSAVTSAAPTVGANNETVFFEIVNVRDEAGVLDASFLNNVSISNPIEQDYTVNQNGVVVHSGTDVVKANAGKISINKGHNFLAGSYYFTVQTTIKTETEEFKNIFEDAFKLTILPKNPTGLFYCPLTQNLKEGTTDLTSQVDINLNIDNFSFELVSHTDKLQIDPKTGQISINPSYDVTAKESIQPVVKVINNITEEVTEFDAGFLTVVLYDTAATPSLADKSVNHFYYPKLGSPVNQYIPTAVELGNAKNGKILGKWFNKWVPAEVKVDRPLTGKYQTLTTNISPNNVTVPHESWLTTWPQNLSKYNSDCLNLRAVAWVNLNKVEYLEDGRSPVSLEIYITDNATPDVRKLEDWTLITEDKITSRIQKTTTEFVGMPYPGDQTGADPDGKKDPTKNANGKLFRLEIDLSNYKEFENFAIGFRYKTTFTGQIKKGVSGNAGTISFQDIHITAIEK